MAKTPKKTPLEHATRSFDLDPTFPQARNIWLYCHERGLTPPTSVMNKFVEKLSSDNTDWLGRLSDSLKKKGKSAKFDSLLLLMRESGMSYQAIADDLNERLPVPHWNKDSIRKRIKRM